MKKPTLSYPWVRVDAAGAGVVSHAGGVLLVEAVHASGAGPGVIGRAGALA